MSESKPLGNTSAAKEGGRWAQPPYRAALVTGSAGFMGRALTGELERRGVEVSECDLALGHDLNDPRTLERLPASGGPEIVFHLAAQASVPQGWRDPAGTYRVNLGATLNVLEFCRRRGATLVFAGSYVYGRPRYQPIDEEHPLSATNPYARSKLYAEAAIRDFSAAYGVRAVILRPFNLYGPGQTGELLIPSIASQIREIRAHPEDEGAGEVILRTPHQRRDYVHRDDAVAGLLLAGDYLVQGRRGSAPEAFNLASGQTYSVKELAEAMIRAAGGGMNLRFTGTERPGDIAETRGCADKARRILGWRCRVSFNQGLKQVVEAALSPSND